MSDSARGMKRVCISELLTLCAGIAAGAALHLFPAHRLLNGALGFASIIMLLICTVIEIQGLKRASTDEKGYMNALRLDVAAILAILFTVMLNLHWPGFAPTCSHGLLFRVISILVDWLVIDTTVRRLTAGGHRESAEFGRITLYTVCIAYVMEVVASVFSIFITDSRAMEIISDVTKAVAFVATGGYALFLGRVYKKL